jgi:hypothetical protein
MPNAIMKKIEVKKLYYIITYDLFPHKAPPAAATEETASGRWNDWTKASFGGDDAQKNKFLRLLGAKKSGNETSGSGSNYSNQSSAIDDNVNQKMSKELEKQFQDGLKMRKQSYGGKRGGLGWS